MTHTNLFVFSTYPTKINSARTQSTCKFFHLQQKENTSAHSNLPKIQKNEPVKEGSILSHLYHIPWDKINAHPYT